MYTSLEICLVIPHTKYEIKNMHKNRSAFIEVNNVASEEKLC